jgi:G3E family GTPase
MNNGCFCCTVRGDLVRILDGLMKRKGKFDAIIVETTGLADPAPILQTLMQDAAIDHFFRLESVITLVDAVNGDATLDAHEEAVKQAAVADRLVITKSDLATPETVAALETRLRRLNPVIAGEDAGYVIFDFAGSAAGLLDGNRLADCDARNPRLTMGEFALDAERGALRLDGHGRIFVRRRGEAEREHAYEWHDRGYAGDAVYNLQRHVVDHLTRGTPLENRVEDYIRNVIVEEAVYRSAAERRHIAMDEIETRQAA